MIVDVYVERCGEDMGSQTEVLIEPSEEFKKRYPLVMAPTVVNVDNDVTAKVRLLNPFAQESCRMPS